MKYTIPGRTGISAKTAILTSAALLLAVGATVLTEPALAADLKVMRMGVGSGNVTSTPAGIDCGSDCSESYGNNVAVALKATAPAGSKFLEWLGDCAGTAVDTCTVQMTEDRWVRARFDID